MQASVFLEGWGGYLSDSTVQQKIPFAFWLGLMFPESGSFPVRHWNLYKSLLCVREYSFKPYIKHLSQLKGNYIQKPRFISSEHTKRI